MDRRSKRAILLVSSGWRHPSPPARFWLRRGLAARQGYRFRRVPSLEALRGLPLESFGAVVLYAHHETVSQPALLALDDYVAGGGGLLAIHAASASYMAQAQWLRILGGRFREHGPVCTFRIEPTLQDDEIFRGIPAFSVRDELYRHDYAPHGRIHFAAGVGSESEPVVWTKYWGVGRVCYCSLGHTSSSIRHPQVCEILGRGLDWVCAAG